MIKKVCENKCQLSFPEDKLMNACVCVCMCVLEFNYTPQLN